MAKVRSAVVSLFLLLVGVTVVPGTALAQGTMFLGVVRGANTLVLFNSQNPSAIVSSLPITGLSAGEVIRGIDVRPANGLLYGLAAPATITTQVRLYLINPITGGASPVGPAVNVQNGGNFWGMSFDPVADRVRVTNNANTNARLHPDTGALVANDTPLSGFPFALDAIAYDNQAGGAAQTTLYGIFVGVPNLFRIGGPQGVPSPDGGVLTSIGPLNVPLSSADPAGGTAAYALDMSPDGTLFAVMRDGAGATSLYTINTTTGAASLVGAIGNGVAGIDSLAVGNAGLTILPTSGVYTTQQRFDMVLLLNAPGRSIVSGSVIFDGLNVTSYVVACATFGRTASGLTTIRCGNFGGLLFGPGNHTFAVSLGLSSGEVVSASVNWNVIASSEP